MTTAFITETVDQELQLTDLQQLNGAAAPILLAWGLGAATGAMGMWLYENADREKIADAVHDLISGESESDNGNSSSYREEPGSGGGGKYGREETWRRGHCSVLSAVPRSKFDLWRDSSARVMRAALLSN